MKIARTVEPEVYIGARLRGYKEKSGEPYWVTIAVQHLIVLGYIVRNGRACDKQMNVYMASINQYQTSSTRCRLRDVGLIEFAGTEKIDGRSQKFWKGTAWGKEVAAQHTGRLSVLLVDNSRVML